MIQKIFFYGSYLIFPLLIFLISITSPSAIFTNSLIILCLFFIYSRFIETAIIRIKKINIVNQKIKTDLKIVVISDLHLGLYQGKNKLQKIVKKVNNINPDLVMIPGDFISYIKINQILQILTPLKNLKAKTIAVNGNHDLHTANIIKKEYDKFNLLNKTLLKYNIQLINDKYLKLNIKNNNLQIFGLQDIWIKTPNYKILNNIDNNQISIALSHNPDSTLDFPIKPDITICGHTHGGQIRIPYFYKIMMPCKHNFDHGLTKVGNKYLYISPGVGTIDLPLRFLMPPQIDILNLKHE